MQLEKWLVSSAPCNQTFPMLVKNVMDQGHNQHGYTSVRGISGGETGGDSGDLGIFAVGRGETPKGQGINESQISI